MDTHKNLGTLLASDVCVGPPHILYCKNLSHSPYVNIELL